MQGVVCYFGLLKVLCGIDFVVCVGELVGLIGFNGVGKIMLMCCMSDGVECSVGSIVLCGSDIG